MIPRLTTHATTAVIPPNARSNSLTTTKIDSLIATVSIIVMPGMLWVSCVWSVLLYAVSGAMMEAKYVLGTGANSS
jgi:hypothetical protein